MFLIFTVIHDGNDDDYDYDDYNNNYYYHHNFYKYVDEVNKNDNF